MFIKPFSFNTKIVMSIFYIYIQNMYNIKFDVPCFFKIEFNDLMSNYLLFFIQHQNKIHR